MIAKAGGYDLKNTEGIQPRSIVPLGSALLLVLLLAACQPTVRVEAPSEPITINLNIKLDADVRLRLEEEAEQDIDDNPEIF